MLFLVEDGMMRAHACVALLVVVAIVGGPGVLVGHANGAEEEVSDTEAVAALFQQAEARVEAWEFRSAADIVAEIESTALYQDDEAVRQRTDVLKERITKAHRQALELERILAGVSTKIDAWRFDEAREILRRMQEPGAYQLGETARQRIVQVEQTNEAEAEKAQQQRAEVAGLLLAAQEKLQASDLAGVSDIVVRIESTDLYQREEAVRRDAAALRTRLDAAEAQTQGQREEVNRILEGIALQIKGWDVAGAAEALALVEEKDIFQLDETVRERAAQLRAGLEEVRQELAQQREHAGKLLEEAGAKVEAGEFAGADEALRAVEKSGLYARDPALRDRVVALRDRILAGEKATEAVRLAQAQNLLEQARAAHERKDYASAKALLERAAGLRVDLGPPLASARDAVNAELQRCASEFGDAKRLYEFGQYEEAKSILVRLKDSGAICGPEIDEGIEKYLADIDVQGEQAAAERAAALAQLAEERRLLMAKLEEKQRKHEAARADLKQARSDWDAGNFPPTGDRLRGAKQQLAELEAWQDPDVQRDQEEVEALLARLPARMEGDELFSEVAALGRAGEWLEAEQKLQVALQYAKGKSFGLTPPQQRTRKEIEDAIEERYGEARRSRARRYWELAEQAKNYIDANEWAHALALLEMVQKAETLQLRPEDMDFVAGQIVLAKDEIQKRNQTLEEVRGLVKAADGMVETDPAGAEMKCRRAVKMAGEAGVPSELILPELERYRKLASSFWPGEIAADVAALKEKTQAHLASVPAACDYQMARFHLKAGSPNLAKPFLENVAASKNADAETVGEATAELEGIQQQIDSMQGRETLKTRKQIDKIYEMEREFQELARKGDHAAADKMFRRIEDERTNLRALRVRCALERGDYPAARGLIDEDADHPAFKDMAAQVAQWDRAEALVAQAMAALRSGRAATESTAFAELEEVDLPGAPFEGTAEVLMNARQVVLWFVAQKANLEQRVAADLARLDTEIARAGARQAAWDRYSQVVALYAEGNWREAVGGLVRLSDPALALHPFEGRHVDAMFDECAARARADVVAEGAKEAEGLLRSASAKVASRDFLGAAGALNKVQGLAIYHVDEDIRTRAAELRGTVDEAEEAAAQLYRKAAEAFRKGDRDTTRRLLTQLRSEYRKTRAFVDHE